jgi:RNA 3'-terminal phosphate cyclase (ATP)
VLRTSLALSVVTGQPFRIERIRAGRQRPGLLRQHVTAVQAAAAISGAEVEGAALGSTSLTFVPGPVRGGDHTFAVGTAGSATLVLQTILPPLLHADAPSRLVLRGGTHNDAAPPWHFVDRVFLATLRTAGVQVETTLRRWGFYPAGGGEFEVDVLPGAPGRLELLERGAVRSVTATAVAAGLPASVAERELRTTCERLRIERRDTRQVVVRDSHGPGNVCWVEVEADGGRELFTGFGTKGVLAEDVAKRVCVEAASWLEAGVPVGEHLADQLLVPMAIGAGGTFRTVAPSLHTRTNAEVIARFVPVRIALDEVGGGAWQITVDR